MMVLDTHAWVWWVSDPDQLSTSARQAADEAGRRRELFVSAISAWEVAMLVRKERLVLTMDVRDWVARSEALPCLSFVPVTPSIAIESVRLKDFSHSDPADRIIVATAMSLGATLLTKDAKLNAYSYVKSLW